jgi:hypothetical protein
LTKKPLLLLLLVLVLLEGMDEVVGVKWEIMDGVGLRSLITGEGKIKPGFGQFG